MRIVQVLFITVGACLAFDKARFQRTIEEREKNLKFRRSLFRSREEVKEVERARGHDDDPEQRNVFFRPIQSLTNSPTPVPTTVSPTPAPVSNRKSIFKIISEDAPPSTILLAMISALDLVFTLDAELDIPITLIAPTDSAFQDGLLPEDLAYFTELYQNPIWENHLACFVLYHAIVGELVTSQFVDGQLAETSWIEESSVLLGTNPFSVNSIPLTQVDILGSNGVVQVISQAPLQLPCTRDSIFVQGSQNAEFVTLISLVNAAGLDVVLQNNRPLTLFAPTETAFTAIPTELSSFLLNPANVEDLRTLLLYHIVPELLFLGNETDAGAYRTAASGELSLTIEYERFLEGNFTVQGGPDANIANVDPGGINVLAKNGVVHLIDQVLIPPGFGTPTTAAPAVMTTSAPVSAAPITGGTAAPNTAAPVIGSVAPNTAAPVGGTIAPNTAAPVGGTVVPNVAAPVEGTVAPNTAAPAGGTVAPNIAAPVGGSIAPIAAPTVGVPTSAAPTGSLVAPTDGNLDPLARLLTSLTDEALLLSSGTVQNTAYQALQVTNPELDPENLADQPIITQRYALFTLYLATSFNNGWTNQERWLTNAPYCDDSGNWFGVTCADDLIQITEIVVNQNGLSGFIPSEIRGMASLRRLEMANDLNGETFLTGDIPVSIGEMNALEIINLRDNSLGFQFLPGEDPVPLPNAIPTTLSNLVNLKTFIVSNNFFIEALNFARYAPMTSLEILDLSVNIFSGIIPTDIGDLAPTLTSLNLDNNLLSGALPTELGRLVGLQSLRISRSDTSSEPDGSCFLADGPCIGGSIPTEIGNLVNLVELWLFENSLNLAIPSEIGNCVLLERLIVFSNELSGIVPTEIGNLQNLATLDMSTNLLGSNLTLELFEIPSLINLNLRRNVFNNTAIPKSFTLPNIQVLRLDDNYFTGDIPPAIGTLVTLQFLNFNLNRLSGVLPSEIGLLQGLQFLDFGNNFISGTVPTEYGGLPQLQEIVLEINLLNGTIPSELGNLGALEQLELGANDFSGTIPTTLGLLANLQDLELTNNSLEGNIPTEIGNLSFLRELELDINELAGPLPSELGNLASLETLRVELSALTGVVPDNVCALTSGVLAEFVADCGVPAKIICECCSACSEATV